VCRTFKGAGTKLLDLAHCSHAEPNNNNLRRCGFSSPVAWISKLDKVCLGAEKSFFSFFPALFLDFSLTGDLTSTMPDSA
jgi:hypothetical protein